MNIVLWVLQVMLALLFAAGSVQQLFTYDRLAEQYPIYKALPQAFWAVYAIIAILCCLGLLLTRVWPIATPIAATVLVVQGVIFAALYAYHAGFQPSFAMWAAWTLGPVAVAAFIAYGRFASMAPA